MSDAIQWIDPLNPILLGISVKHIQGLILQFIANKIASLRHWKYAKINQLRSILNLTLSKEGFTLSAKIIKTICHLVHLNFLSNYVKANASNISWCQVLFPSFDYADIFGNERLSAWLYRWWTDPVGYRSGGWSNWWSATAWLDYWSCLIPSSGSCFIVHKTSVPLC